ncbi:major facilitator superfamily permease [Cuniculiplasma divulgatum]|uniref:Major facilitator superfamily permease n=1 Tax=Cuniculiplasma divulgatum TaxID=1673428 RepID=A0A1N5SME4_9ARCH|nr:major facilitator superfamily permease [Cuniculiplasma divulgatum]
MPSNKSIIGIRSFLSSVGATAASTFVGIYAVLIGASASEMGWLQSSANAISNGGQILWGKISDRTGSRRIFLIIGSIILASLWAMMPYASDPVNLIVIYSLISLFGSMITVNWFSLIADLSDSSVRGKFLTFINNISSAGTIISLIVMVFLFGGDLQSNIMLPFFLSSATYLISSVLLVSLKETNHRARFEGSLLATIRKIRYDDNFFPYFRATNIQGFFWSMAWPMFPITIVSVMGFGLRVVAILTIVSLSVTIVIQTLLGRVTDKTQRPPLIFVNRVMLSLIPVFYAFFHSFLLFVLLESYSGFLGALQNIVMNSYLLDIIPTTRRAEYISIINGFNGLVYLMGALVGGYLLQYALSVFPLVKALEFSYMIVFAGRFSSSFLFLKLKEPEKKGRTPLGLFSILYRQKIPGSPSGGTIKMK